MLTAQDARNLADRIFGMTKLPECALNLSSTEDVFIRFANNGITTSGYRVDHSVSISATTEDKRSGSASVSEFSEEALRKAWKKQSRWRASRSPIPRTCRPWGPSSTPRFKLRCGHGGGARRCPDRPREGDPRCGARRQLTAAGLVQRTATASAVANKAGLFGYHESTYAGLTNTMRNSGGTSSGWATQVSTSVADLNGEDAGRIAPTSAYAARARSGSIRENTRSSWNPPR